MVILNEYEYEVSSVVDYVYLANGNDVWPVLSPFIFVTVYALCRPSHRLRLLAVCGSPARPDTALHFGLPTERLLSPRTRRLVIRVVVDGDVPAAPVTKLLHGLHGPRCPVRSHLRLTRSGRTRWSGCVRRRGRLEF